MNHGNDRVAPAMNAGSMADIAFLLLTFFLITTQINNDKGLAIVLPPHVAVPNTVDIHDRNLFKIQINSNDQLLVEDELRKDLSGVREEIKTFILNFDRNQTLSENPMKAVISLKTDRGTSHRAFILALDEIQGAYYEIYGERVGLSSADFRKLDPNRSAEKVLFDKARAGIPMNISIAEPTSIAVPLRK